MIERTTELLTLKGKTIAVGVGGGIAAYRSLELIRLLKKMGARVMPLPTRNALQFVGELSFEALAGEVCHSHPLSVRAGQITHIEIAESASAFIVAPATADLIAKMVHGMADELLLQTLLSFRGPCVVAPAMESQMWSHPATRSNVDILRSRGAIVCGPNSGLLASGRSGVGRMVEPNEIIEHLLYAISPKDFSGRKVLVTAGPTVEDIDPVRFISNRSSGKMGTALVRALAQRGADVVLIHGPMSSAIPSLSSVTAHGVRSASEMYSKVMNLIETCDTAILCAAVADFTPSSPRDQKIKKSDETDSVFSFSKTQDILSAVGKLKKRPFLVGFAAESQSLEEEALRKCREKNCDLVCANLVTGNENALESDFNQVTIVDSQSKISMLQRSSKDEIAHAILDVIIARTQFLTSSGP